MVEYDEMRRLLSKSNQGLLLDLGDTLRSPDYGVARMGNSSSSTPRWRRLLYSVGLLTSISALAFGITKAHLEHGSVELLSDLFIKLPLGFISFFLLHLAFELYLSSRAGKKSFHKLIPDIRIILCKEWNACQKVKQYEDQTQLGMAIADALSAATISAPIATVSALVVKIGVKKFCNCR